MTIIIRFSVRIELTVGQHINTFINPVCIWWSIVLMLIHVIYFQITFDTAIPHHNGCVPNNCLLLLHGNIATEHVSIYIYVPYIVPQCNNMICIQWVYIPIMICIQWVDACIVYLMQVSLYANNNLPSIQCLLSFSFWSIARLFPCVHH